MIQTLLETMKRGQEVANVLKDAFKESPTKFNVDEAEKFCDLHQEKIDTDEKNTTGEVNFFEATETVSNQLNAIDAEYAEWRKSIVEKISVFGAIGFCQNLKSYVFGLRFKKNRPPNDLTLFRKMPFKRIFVNTGFLYWIPKGTNAELKEITRMSFDMNHRYGLAIGFNVSRRYKGQRPKITRTGGSWIVSFHGEIQIMGDHKRLKKFVPKGCNRINEYRLERLRRGF